MDEGTELKKQVAQDLEALWPEIQDLSQRIHANPELGFQEAKASQWLCTYLQEKGFRVERDLVGLSTAFRATYGRDRPAIAFLAEYDALPNLGHACGHNVIAAAAAGAGVASRRAIDQLGGSVQVIGTPGEELYGGKAIMVERGAFVGRNWGKIVRVGRDEVVIAEEYRDPLGKLIVNEFSMKLKNEAQ